jgi:hypothetical protein
MYVTAVAAGQSQRFYVYSGVEIDALPTAVLGGRPWVLVAGIFYDTVAYELF